MFLQMVKAALVGKTWHEADDIFEVEATDLMRAKALIHKGHAREFEPPTKGKTKALRRAVMEP